MSRLRAIGRTAYQASINFDRDNCFDQAATISYFTLLSLLPLAIVLVALGAALIGSVDAAQQGLQYLLRDLVRRLGPDVFAQAREVGSQAGRLGWPFILLAMWTGSKVFSKVEGALDHVFRVPKRRSFPLRKVFAFGLVILLVLALVASIAFTSAVAALNAFLDHTALAFARQNPLYTAINSVVSRYLIPWLISVFTFSFIYKVVPARFVSWRPAVIAGAVAGSLWELLKIGFTLYLGRFANYARTYGALETVVVFTIWVNLSATILLWGGEIAALLAGARGGTGLEGVPSEEEPEVVATR